ncbi:MAG: YihY/virulence factor BrkB family protein [Bacteroidota bacterium]
MNDFWFSALIAELKKTVLKKIATRFFHSKFITRLIGFTKRKSLPGFKQMPMYDVAEFFVKGMQKGVLTERASSLTFSFFLAFFPSVIFLFSLIPYIPIENFQEQILGLLKEFMPHDAYSAVSETIEDIVRNQHGGALSFGFLAALYFYTNGFNALISSFNSSYHVVEIRSSLMQRLISLLLVIISTVLIIIAISLLIGSEVVLNYLIEKEQLTFYLIQIGRWLIVFTLCFCMISFIYYLAPSRKIKWGFVSAGSIFATVFSILTSLLFAYYVNHFGKYNKLYGSIGTLIVILLWIYFNSLILLLGFELNASIHRAKQGKIPELIT